MINEGIYSDLSSEEYHSHKDSISRSALLDFDKSPYTYWSKHLNPNRPKQEKTKQMELGSAFHSLILEPHLFDKEYVMKPKPVLLKDVGREVYNIYKNAIDYLEKSDKTILSVEEWDNLMAMRDKLHSNKEAMQLIEGARIENSFFWQDDHSGLMLKCRPDILHENMIVDLKTCSDASPRSFQNEMVKYGYHIQGAMIRDAVEIIEGRRINTVINICMETKYPYNMAIYKIDEFAVDEGHMKYKQLCLDLKNCLIENVWPDFGIQEISLPKWYCC